MPSTSPAISLTTPLNISVSLGAPVLSPPPGNQPFAVSESALLGRESLFGPNDEFFNKASPKFSGASLAAANFSWNAALTTALCSTLAYRASTEISRIATQTWSLRSCDPLSLGGTNCFVASTSDTIIVSFRGTQQIADWLINLNAVSVGASYGSVHRGFYFAFQSVKLAIEAVIERLGLGSRKIVLTGHSLGGALAMIAAGEWTGRLPVSAVYTYGQPCVGFTAFRSFIGVNYPNTIYRFVNEDDVVPRVPPGYRHVGRVFHFDGQGGVLNESLGLRTPAAEPPTMTQAEFAILKSQLEAARTVAPVAMNESVRSNAFQEGFFPSVADHSLERYLAKILDEVG